MAIIHGRAESEKELLKKYPKQVQKIEDIPKVEQEMKEALKVKEDDDFKLLSKNHKFIQLIN